MPNTENDAIDRATAAHLTPGTRALADTMTAAAAAGDRQEAERLLERLDERDDWREAFYGMTETPRTPDTGAGHLAGPGDRIRRTMTLAAVIRDSEQLAHLLRDGTLHAVLWSRQRQPVHIGERCTLDGTVDENAWSPLEGDWTVVRDGSLAASRERRESPGERGRDETRRLMEAHKDTPLGSSAGVRTPERSRIKPKVQDRGDVEQLTRPARGPRRLERDRGTPVRPHTTMPESNIARQRSRGRGR